MLHNDIVATILIYLLLYELIGSFTAIRVIASGLRPVNAVGYFIAVLIWPIIWFIYIKSWISVGVKKVKATCL